MYNPTLKEDIQRLALASQAGNRDAFDGLVEAAEVLVRWAARPYLSRLRGLEEEDLYQELRGHIGYILRHWDATRCKFTTALATGFVHHARRVMRLHNDVVRPKISAKRLNIAVHAASTAFFVEWGRYPTVDELVELTGLTPAQLRHARSDNARAVALEQVPASREPSPAADAAARESSAVVDELLRALPGHYRHIVVRYYGLDGDAPESEVDIGRRLGVSRQAVNGIRRAARARLEKSPLAGKLASAMGLDADMPARYVGVRSPGSVAERR